MKPAVFFDRDGVVNELVADPVSGRPESPLRPEQVRLIPSAAQALLALRAAGYAVIGVSNQPAAAKGTVEIDDLHAVQERVLDLLAGEGFVPDGFFLCFHHPAGVVAVLTADCDCRKPAPGLLLRAAAEFDLDLERSWMVGDTDADVEAGRAAGCSTLLIEHPGSAHKRRRGAVPDTRAADLEAAARHIAVPEPR